MTYDDLIRTVKGRIKNDQQMIEILRRNSTKKQKTTAATVA